MGKRKTRSSDQAGIEAFLSRTKLKVVVQRPLSPVQNTTPAGDFEAENEFERECAAIKERNAALMQTLKLPEAVENVRNVMKVAKRNGQQAKKEAKQTPRPPPVRKIYSLRSKGALPTADSNSCKDELEEVDTEPEVEEPEVDWNAVEDSSIHKYLTQNSTDHVSWASMKSDGDIKSAVKLPCELFDNSLAKIYSLDICGDLLAAAGKNGRASIFGLGKLFGGTKSDCADHHTDSAVGPLLSCKLHKGWISQVQFLPTKEERKLLISSANDGVVSIWDTSKVANGVPRLMTSNDCLHEAGIFCIHAMEKQLLTASKDCTVVLSDLQDSTAIKKVRVFDDIHTGVVKSVQWQGPHKFISSSTDRSIKVVDTRTRKAVISIEDSHSSAINFVTMSPACNNIVLSASFDPICYLHDLRSPVKPLFQLEGHAASKRCWSIYKPCFWVRGKYVATGGEGTNMMTLYSTETGQLISRGGIGYTPTTLKSFLDNGALIACAKPKSVLFYGPDIQKVED